MLIFFRLLIEYTEDKGNDADRWKGYVYVVCMVVVATLQVTAVQHSLHIAFKSAMRVHTSIIGVVYAKVLKTSMSRSATVLFAYAASTLCVQAIKVQCERW